MNRNTRWIALALLAAASAAQAFTDSDADMKEAAADRAARVVITGKAAPQAPVRTAWVPPTAKSLDGFKPVFPREPVVVARQRPMLLLAKAEQPASSGKGPR